MSNIMSKAEFTQREALSDKLGRIHLLNTKSIGRR